MLSEDILLGDIKFWSRVDIRENDECWIFTYSDPNLKKRTYYGQYRHDGKRILAHRMAYTLYHGEIPDDMFVCHHCDNPPCCNPHHLFIGTHRDNVEDMISKRKLRSAGMKLLIEEAYISIVEEIYSSMEENKTKEKSKIKKNGTGRKTKKIKEDNNYQKVIDMYVPDQFTCYTYRDIANETGLDAREVRRIIRKFEKRQKARWFSD